MYKRRRSSSYPRKMSARPKANIRGRGDYQVNQIVKGSTHKPLQFGSTKGCSGDVFVTHREFVQNIVVTPPVGGGSTPFQNNVFPINPALLNSFPFLSQIAQAFTLYEFDGLVFEYKPTSGEYGSSSSNQLGKVIMCTNYDPDQPKFTSSIAMENYDYANASKPSMGLMHGVECKSKSRATNILYNRSGAVTKDLVFTDLGLFQIATEGINFATGTTNSAIVGELWVSYKVRFSRANINAASVGTSVLFDSFAGYQTTGTTYTAAGQTAGTNGAWLGTAIAATSDLAAGNPYRWAPAPSLFAAQPASTNNLGGILDTNLTAGQMLLITSPNNVLAVPTYTGLLCSLLRYRFPLGISAGIYCVQVTPFGLVKPSFSNAGWATDGSGGLLCTNCVPIQNPQWQRPQYSNDQKYAASCINNGTVQVIPMYVNTGGIVAPGFQFFEFYVQVTGPNSSIVFNMQNGNGAVGTNFDSTKSLVMNVSQVNPLFLA